MSFDSAVAVATGRRAWPGIIVDEVENIVDD
jgi:hypothetical protein